MTELLEEYRQKVAGTNIDTRTLLSTDYFNAFNSVVMVLEMLPDAPELLEEVEQWQFKNYCEHYAESGLDFSQLAIEAYGVSPAEFRVPFEQKINAMRVFVEESSRLLRALYKAEETRVFGEVARFVALQMRSMMEDGSGIVHGSGNSTQAAIDALF